MLIQTTNGSELTGQWPGPVLCWRAGSVLESSTSLFSCAWWQVQPTVSLGTCSHLRAQEGSWWFGLTWVLAAFLHSSHGTKQASTITALDQADRTHTGAPWLQQGCPVLSIIGLASSAVGWQKGVVCRAASTGGFFVPPGHLVASKEPGVCCQSATR